MPGARSRAGRHPETMPRIPLPAELGAAAFSVGRALELEIGRGRLKGTDLARPFYGVRAQKVEVLAHGYLPVLRPDDRFSHTTAAELWPLPLPRTTSGLHVTARPPRNAPRGKGVVGHTSSAGHIILRSELPVSDPATLFIELAALLQEDDLVAVGDALVLEPAVLDPLDLRPWITLDELRSACQVSHAPGCRRARRAAARVRIGAESRMETLLRLLLLRAGLPEPELNQELYDDRGRWIGRFDLVYREARVIVEYDGDQHRTDTGQYDLDISRIDRAIAARWAVVRVRVRGVFVDPGDTIRRVREALAA